VISDLEELIELSKVSKDVNFSLWSVMLNSKEYREGRLPKAWRLFEYVIEVDIQRTVLLGET
jgi:hypothetical protein